MPNALSIRNATIVTPEREIREGDLHVDTQGRIDSKETTQQSLDANGALLLPGFIDIHTHGAAGASVMDGSKQAVEKIARAKLQEGVTQFLPTTMTASEDKIASALRAVAAYRAQPTAARVPGVHIEGPFIHPDRAGAQNPAHIRNPDLEEIDRHCQLTNVLLISLATERPGGIDFLHGMKKRGIITSLAHTTATYTDFLEAKAAGLSHLTHFGNQMSPLHHREIGIVGAGLLDNDISLELICDGVHLAPEMIKLIFQHVPAERLMLITDSISPSWQPDGHYMESGLEVVVEDGVCRLLNGSLAGSTLRFHEALHRVLQLTQQPIEQIVCTTSSNQAQSLGLKDFGRLEEGHHADMVLLDPNNHSVLATIVGGEILYQTPQEKNTV